MRIIYFFITVLLSLTLTQCDSSTGNLEDNQNPEQPENHESEASVNSFVSVENGDFVVDGEKFKFAGTNSYHLPTYQKINEGMVDETFDAFEEAGVTVVRMWAFFDGPSENNDSVLQPSAGEYNEAGLQNLDKVIAKGKEHGIRFILTLVNKWDAYGGVKQYNEWAGNPEGGVSHFINNSDTQQWYKDYISMLINRENTETGVEYKNESAIFSWEIMNEGLLEGGDPQEMRDWYQEIAQFIKSEDPNHMVSTGEEGFESSSPSGYSYDKYSNDYVLRSDFGSSYKLNTAIPEIDYGTAHWYPAVWGFNGEENMLAAQKAWLKDHIEIAEKEGKPFVLGEYGDDNGWGDSGQLKMYKDFWKNAEEMELDGSLIWQLTPTHTKCFEFGGNICWPGGRQDQELYDAFTKHIDNIQ